LARGWVFVVATIDRNRVYSTEKKKRWADLGECYGALSTMSRDLLWELRRLCKRNGWKTIKNEWIAVVEAHRSGWPHANFLIYCPELADELEAERLRRLDRGRSARDSTLVHGELQAALQRSGWGIQSTAEQVRDLGALGSYVTKLAGEQLAVGGELAKLTQAPYAAPHRFRRLRSGKSFLAKKHKNEEVTGTLIRREFDVNKSVFGALPLHKVSAEAEEMVALCCQLEGERIEAEAKRERPAGPVFELARGPGERAELMAKTLGFQLATWVDGRLRY